MIVRMRNLESHSLGPIADMSNHGVSISIWEFIRGGLILGVRYTLVHGLCFFLRALKS